MVRSFTSYLAMGSASEATQALINSDMQDLGVATQNLASHLFIHIGYLIGSVLTDHSLLFSSLVLHFRYLLVLDRTHWRTNMLTTLLVPYIFFSLPDLLFYVLRGEVGKWIALISVVARLFYPQHFPDWFEAPGTIILLVAAAPSYFAAENSRPECAVLVCLLIGSKLLREHIKASGGYREAIKKGKGVSNTMGILLLFIYPVWCLVVLLIMIWQYAHKQSHP
ncbi:hypothetical protein PR202_ga13615 [Eleusine coracana subsp. coracana]|uniref:Uncharacterized protein n=1 Tax=Eleusine coracana subsp. coracana TaxID=191504 RepID=A0AAV5CFA8_ELECO|nr:hypothetical protein PR202_ga13615 [Eleusine coracana subsp. coracana]